MELARQQPRGAALLASLLPPRCQILGARSIIGAAIRKLKGLTEQAELGAENQQGERLAVVLTSTACAAASPHFYVAATVEPADDPGKSLTRDRDLVWRRTDSVVLGRFAWSVGPLSGRMATSTIDLAARN